MKHRVDKVSTQCRCVDPSLVPGASEVFAQLLDVRPGDQPILPEDIDPVPICLDCLDCLDSEKLSSRKAFELFPTFILFNKHLGTKGSGFRRLMSLTHLDNISGQVRKKKSARCCLSRSLVHRAGVHLRNRWQSCEAS
jgi:hypothetical protein